MKLTAKQYAAVLFEAVSESRPEDQDNVLDNFVAVLRQQQALSLLDEIEKEYLRLSGVRTAEITTAAPLQKHEEAVIIERLNAYVGGKVELRKKIDEGLVGGVVVRLDDELLDGSVKKSMDELKKEMVQ